MQASDAVILVPGFFGFGTFGSPDGPHIAYFERVAATLQLVTGWQPEQFVSLEPPPTGPLWTRVECLHTRLEELSQRYERIHLIGHSTGGVDARLVMNTKYLWPGGPLDRRPLLDRIGHVVTVSAPFRGTPFADRFPVGLELVAPAATALSIATAPSVLEGPSQFWNAFSALLPDGWVPKDADASEIAALADPAVCPQIHAFLKHIVEDRRLIGDLSVRAMRKLNEEIDGGDHRLIESFVTVAPRPALMPTWHPGRSALRYLYALTYGFAHPSADSGLDIPLSDITTSGEPRMITSEQAREPLGSNDGVVPIGSQTLHGHAAGIVVSDHLDVIGHYPGGYDRAGRKEEHGGITFFDSEAHFRDAEFRWFWTRVGRLLLDPAP